MRKISRLAQGSSRVKPVSKNFPEFIGYAI
jgi:hypothetical protein